MHTFNLGCNFHGLPIDFILILAIPLSSTFGRFSLSHLVHLIKSMQSTFCLPLENFKSPTVCDCVLLIDGTFGVVLMSFLF